MSLEWALGFQNLKSGQAMLSLPAAFGSGCRTLSYYECLRSAMLLTMRIMN